MKKTIQIMGCKVTVAFNLAVQVAYEEISGEAFDVSKMNTTKASASLWAAAIIANNPELNFDMQKMMVKATRQELQELDEALAECMRDWYAMPEVLTEKEEASTKKHD